jgi:hypothetical protein
MGDRKRYPLQPRLNSGKVQGLTALFSGLNPKNLAFTLLTALTIVQAGEGTVLAGAFSVCHHSQCNRGRPRLVFSIYR